MLIKIFTGIVQIFEENELFCLDILHYNPKNAHRVVMLYLLRPINDQLSQDIGPTTKTQLHRDAVWRYGNIFLEVGYTTGSFR